MTRNLSLIPTIEAGPEAAPPARPIRAAPVVAETVPERFIRAPSRRKGVAARASSRPSRSVAEAAKYASILLLFAAVAWPLYLWIGK